MKTRILITGLAIAVLTTVASAQVKSTSQDQKSVTQSSVANYDDVNNNGICDYYETNGLINGKGRRMGSAQASQGRGGMPAGQGRGMRPAQGRGMGPGQGKGAAPGGRYFIDENKNGICDLRETPDGK
jgi:hypothetical protein